MQGQAQLKALAPGALKDRRQHLERAAHASLEPPCPQPQRLDRFRKGSHLHAQKCLLHRPARARQTLLHPDILKAGWYRATRGLLETSCWVVLHFTSCITL